MRLVVLVKPPKSKLLELFAQFQTLQTLLVPPKTLPSGPAHSAGPHQNVHPDRLWSAKCRTFVIFSPLFVHPKTHRKSTYSQNLPKPQKLSPKASPSSILEHFGSHFGIHFQRFFITFTKKANNAPTL